MIVERDRLRKNQINQMKTSTSWLPLAWGPESLRQKSPAFLGNLVRPVDQSYRCSGTS